MTQPADHAAFSADAAGALPMRAGIPWVPLWILLLCATALLTAGVVVATGGERGGFLPSLAITTCLAAAFFDAWRGRIPNPLTYPAILFGLALNGFSPLLTTLHWGTASSWLGAVGPWASVTGFALCTLLAMLGILLGGVHGGDMKLLAAVAALLGMGRILDVMLVALLAAVGYSVVNLAVVGRLNKAIRLGATRVMELFYLRRFVSALPADAKPLGSGDASHIPMAVPLAVGVVIAQAWQWHGGGG